MRKSKMTVAAKLQLQIAAISKSRIAKRTISFILKRGLQLSSVSQRAFPNSPLVLEFSGRFLLYMDQHSKAVEPLERASHLAPGRAIIWESLASSYQKLNRPWLQLEAIRNALQCGPATPHRLIRHARIARKMNRYGEAAESYEKAIAGVPQRISWKFEFADLMRDMGQPDTTRKLYEEIEHLSNNSSVRKFGVGHLLQRDGRWADAAVEYKRRAQTSDDAELHYRIAQSLDYSYEWFDAEQWYRRALAGKPDAHWYRRLGFVLERQEKPVEAEWAYKCSLEMAQGVGTSFRLGCVEAGQGKWREASVSLLKSYNVHPETPSSPEETTEDNDVGLTRFDTISLKQAADQAVSSRKWQRAASIYKLLIDRASDHNLDLYVKRGKALYLSGQFEQAASCLIEARIDAVHFGMDHSIFKRAASRKTLEDYCYLRASLPLRQKTIVYEAFGGQSMACSPLAVFRSLVKQPDFFDWLHVWVVNDATVVPDAFRNLRNVVFIRKNSFGYIKFLASASHLINNSTYPAWFVRRDDQRYLNTWHGTPLKTLGIKMNGRFLEHANGARNFLQATHLIVPNDHTARSTINDFGIKGLIEHKLKVTGYPRSDLTVSPAAEDLEAARQVLGLQPGVPVLFYAPTWRGTHKNIDVNVDRLRNDLRAMSSKGYQIVYRGHSMEQTALQGLKLDVIIAPAEVDTSEILALTDVLVTDYSSVFFEFIPRKKPIIFYAFDFDEYTADRGFYLDIHQMPGMVVRSIEALLTALDKPVINETVHARAISEFCALDDGKASSRVIDFFIRGDVPKQAADDQKRILFYAGPFMANGITTSFVNLSTALTEAGLNCYLGIDPSAIEKEEGRLTAISALPDEVQLIGRTSLMPMTPEQRWLVNAALTMKEIPNSNISDVLRTAYGLEYRRVFSDANFESVIQFEGYNYFWSIMFASSGNERKVAYFHNDMYQEWYTKNPALQFLFRTFRDFDRLVSVSADLCEHNRESMSGTFKLPSNNFTSSMNIISPSAISHRAFERLDEDLEPWLIGGRTFIAVGRLSSEKDHLKLLNAFAALLPDQPGTKLLIIGDGPLRQMLDNRIKKLGLESSVHLAGHRSNAFPAMRASMCLVLPSNHEGQPMVLLEALTLGTKIIATDIPGNRGVLGERYGHLVENSVEGLREAMRRCLARELPEQALFDANEYRRQAISDFMTIIS
jgi:CDP-glycerol glycerophosphotransferase